MAVVLIAQDLQSVPIAGRGYLSTGPLAQVDQRVSVNNALARRPIDILDRELVARVRRTISTDAGAFRVEGMDASRRYDLIGRETAGVYSDFLVPDIQPATD